MRWHRLNQLASSSATTPLCATGASPGIASTAQGGSGAVRSGNCCAGPRVQALRFRNCWTRPAVNADASVPPLVVALLHVMRLPFLQQHHTAIGPVQMVELPTQSCPLVLWSEGERGVGRAIVPMVVYSNKGRCMYTAGLLRGCLLVRRRFCAPWRCESHLGGAHCPSIPRDPERRNAAELCTYAFRASASVRPVP